MSNVTQNSSIEPIQQDLFREGQRVPDDSEQAFELKTRKFDEQLQSLVDFLKTHSVNPEKGRRDMERIAKELHKKIAVSTEAVHYQPRKLLETFRVFSALSAKDLLKHAHLDTSAVDALRGDWQRISDDIRRAMIVYALTDEQFQKMVAERRENRVDRRADSPTYVASSGVANGR